MSTLDALARRAKSAFDRNTTARSDWIATTFELANTIREAREKLSSNEAFGIWLEKAGVTLSKNDRAALINLSTHAKAARAFLEQNSDCWSWRVCWDAVRLPSLGTRQEDGEAAKDPGISNVVTLNIIKPKTEPAAVTLTPRPPSPPIPEGWKDTHDKEKRIIGALRQLSDVVSLWQGDPAPIIDYWSSHRGDMLSPMEVRKMSRFLARFADALEFEDSDEPQPYSRIN